MRFPLIIISYIAVEIIFLILIGQAIGVIATLLWMGLSGVLGVVLIRISGGEIIQSIGQLQENHAIARNQQNLANILSGLLLIIPGFFSDFLAILIFIPFFRQIFIAIFFMRSSLSQPNIYEDARKTTYSAHSHGQNEIIEGEILDDNLGNRR